jgi:hypothetical protein
MPDQPLPAQSGVMPESAFHRVCDERNEAQAERDRYRDALQDAAEVLGTGECTQIACEGCAYEAKEAARIVRAALDQERAS